MVMTERASFSRFMSVCAKTQKDMVRFGDQRVFVLVNRMCVYEVQVNNRISVTS